MKSAIGRLVGPASFLLFTAGAYALTATPYQGIVDRNVFGLKPPPPPTATTAEAPKTPLPPITLNGITTLLGTKRAFISMQMPAKPPEPAKPQSFMLSEGQRDGDIEMIEIDEKAGSVKINAFGTITNIPFPKITASSAPASPGTHGAAPTGIPAPPQNPFAPPGGFQQRSIPSRTLRMPSMQNQGTPGSATTGFPGNNSIAAAGTPPPGGYSFGANAPQAAQEQPPLSRDEQIIMMEAERELHKNDPKYPPLPPTAATSLLNPGSTAGPSVPNSNTSVNRSPGAPPAFPQ